MWASIPRRGDRAAMPVGSATMPAFDASQSTGDDRMLREEDLAASFYHREDADVGEYSEGLCLRQGDAIEDRDEDVTGSLSVAGRYALPECSTRSYHDYPQ